MAKITASQVAGKLGVSAYTVKRWYAWYEKLTEEQIQSYVDSGMPRLPKYETVGSMGWRYWNEEDLDQLQLFRSWVPHTKQGVFKK